MAKALFHKNQRVFVKPVGTWAIVERVIPQWVKGLDEPMKIHYDVGLGREFSATDLMAEDTQRGLRPEDDELVIENWRILRAKNRWTSSGDDTSHPFPGTFPVVVTDEQEWGGWRVPGSEYDRDPHKIEYQARLIVASPHLMKVAKRLAEHVSENPEDCSREMREVARTAVVLLRQIYDVPENLPAAAE